MECPKLRFLELYYLFYLSTTSGKQFHIFLYITLWTIPVVYLTKIAQKKKKKDTSMITFLKQYNTYLVLRSSHAWLRIGRQLFSIHLCRLLPGLCFPNSYLHYWDLFWRFFSWWFLVFLFFFPPEEVAIS